MSAAYFQKPLHFAIFAPILIVMLSRRILLPRYKNSFSKAQTLCNVLDIPVAAWNTNSATQQLSNSATQQLSNSATRLCPDKRAYFSFRQQHNHFFSYIFADGNRAVNLFPIKPQRVPRMRSQIEENIPFKALACSACFAVILRNKPQRPLRAQRDTGKYQTISQPP